MLEGFDELFNKFFGNKKTDDNKNKVEEFINMLNNYKDITGIELNENDELGEPTSVEQYIKDGITYEKKIWDVEGGKIVKIEIKHVKTHGEIEVPIKITPSRFKESSLEEELAHAISVEDYERAAQIRDEISKRDTQVVNEPKKRGRAKKNK